MNKDQETLNSEMLAALTAIMNVLAGNPMVKVGNSTVHYAYMMAKGAVNKVKANSLAA